MLLLRTAGPAPSWGVHLTNPWDLAPLRRTRRLIEMFGTSILTFPVATHVRLAARCRSSKKAAKQVASAEAGAASAALNNGAAADQDDANGVAAASDGGNRCGAAKLCMLMCFSAGDFLEALTFSDHPSVSSAFVRSHSCHHRCHIGNISRSRRSGGAFLGATSSEYTSQACCERGG